MSFASVAFVPAAIADTITITVNSTGDGDDAIDEGGELQVCETSTPGECTLRAAIQTANQHNGVDTINFNISGSQVHTITPSTPMPHITENVSINGFSQPGSSANTAVSPNPINAVIKIELDGQNAAASDSGGIYIADSASSSSLTGLSIFNFAHLATDGSGLDGANVMVRAESVKVAGNFIGLRADGMTIGTGSNDTGVFLSNINAGQPLADVQIGGANPEDRNVIYNFSNYHITAGIVGDASYAKVYGNYIGIAKDGLTDLSTNSGDTLGLNGPYTMGINLVSGSENIIGGPLTGQKNLISGGTVGVIISTPKIKVQGNFIGTDYTGHVNTGITTGIGVQATAASEAIIGGVNPGEGNVIAGVSGAGVSIASFHLNDVDPSENVAPYDILPINNAILGNSIYDISEFNFAEFGNMNQGIDLYNVVDTSDPADFNPEYAELRGPTPNDVGDADDTANHGMNYPVLRSAQQVGQDLDIHFDLDVAGSPNDQYRVEFFVNDTSTIFGYGPGQIYLGSTNQSNGANKDVTLDLGSLDITGKALTATVTVIDSNLTYGFGDTSEFSQNISVGSATDFDSDGISDEEENAAPNNGDGNDDGTLDSLQSTISSYRINNSSTYATFTTDGCSENGTVSSLGESDLVAQDSNFEYPFGLTDFSLNCSRGGTVEVTKIIFTNDYVDSMTVRKYRPNEPEHFFEVPGSSVLSGTIGSEPVVILSYSIQDGGSMDDDGLENGVIVDPVGLATVRTSSSNISNPSPGDSSGSSSTSNAGNTSKSASGSLSTTGVKYFGYLLFISMSLAGVGYGIVLVSRTSYVRRKLNR